MNRILLAWFSAIIVTTSVGGQDFTNLNFESAQVVPSYTNSGRIFIPTANALPGWSAFLGTNQLSLIEYNPSGTLIPNPVDLLGSNTYVIAGSFSAQLYDGGSISQTGLVPSGTESLLFDTTSPSPLVSLGGQNLSYEAIGSGTSSYGRNYTIYGADISTFAGQMETLTFSEAGYLDDIQFSPNVVPEPSSALLLFLGSGILFYIRKGRRLWS